MKIDKKTCEYIFWQVDGFIRELKKSNDMWRKSQEDVSQMILNKIRQIREEEAD